MEIFSTSPPALERFSHYRPSWCVIWRRGFTAWRQACRETNPSTNWSENERESTAKRRRATPGDRPFNRSKQLFRFFCLLFFCFLQDRSKRFDNIVKSVCRYFTHQRTTQYRSSINRIPVVNRTLQNINYYFFFVLFFLVLMKKPINMFFDKWAVLWRDLNERTLTLLANAFVQYIIIYKKKCSINIYCIRSGLNRGTWIGWVKAISFTSLCTYIIINAV